MAVTYRDQPTPWPHLLLILTTCLFLIVRKDGKQALAKFQQTKCTAKGAGKKGKSNHTWQLFFFFDPQKYLLTSTVLSFHHDFPMFALPVWHAINCCPDPACYAPVTPCLHCLPGTRQWVGMHGSVKPELHPTTAHISAGGVWCKWDLALRAQPQNLRLFANKQEKKNNYFFNVAWAQKSNTRGAQFLCTPLHSFAYWAQWSETKCDAETHGKAGLPVEDSLYATAFFLLYQWWHSKPQPCLK